MNWKGTCYYLCAIVVFGSGCAMSTVGTSEIPATPRSYEEASCQTITLRLNSYKGKLVAVPVEARGIGRDGSEMFMRASCGGAATIMAHFNESAVPANANLDLGTPLILKGKITGEELSIPSMWVDQIEVKAVR